MVAGVVSAAGPELARRAALPQPGMLLLLAGWMRPTVSAAALLAAAAAAFLVTGGPVQTPAAAGGGLADALGYPTTVADWVDDGQTPSVEALVVALEGDAQ
jgi:CTP:molybdopterin cytidylyltransferase MocA